MGGIFLELPLGHGLDVERRRPPGSKRSTSKRFIATNVATSGRAERRDEPRVRLERVEGRAEVGREP